MNKTIPAWALRAATAEDHGFAREAHRHDRMQIKWPNERTLRSWAKQQGWSTPLFSFEEAFLTKMLETKENFAQAIQESGIEILLPVQAYKITDEKIRELDALYEQRSSSGRPTSWGSLVEELREIRRAVEAGILVTLEDAQTIQSWESF